MKIHSKQMPCYLFVATIGTVIGLFVVVGCVPTLTDGDTDDSEDYIYEISPEVVPHTLSLENPYGGDPIPVAAYEDENGVITDFVQDQVIFSPRNQQDLDDFLQTYDGEIVGDDSVPPAPASLGITVPSEYLEPTEYAIRIKKLPDLTQFSNESRRRGANGLFRFSSEAAARLMALATHEQLAGRNIQPNWVYTFDDMLHRTEEMPLQPTGFEDAMGYNAFLGPTAPDSNRSTIATAWQFMEASGQAAMQWLGVAVIDGGFWLDASGAPMLSPVGIGTDLPGTPIQYDFHEDDYIADGPNPGDCGSPCPWHGNSSVSVAAAFIDNQAAIAGSGGQVAQPYLFKVRPTGLQVRRAVRTLIAWGASVANMSFSGACNDDCVEWKEDNNYYLRFQEALDHGIVLVASAGNDAINVDAHRVEPCVIPGVICVGALENWTNRAIGYSNYGDSVDMWAPTNIPAMPNGDSPNDLTTAGGTSASSPLVAGVAAMLKRIEPSMNWADVQNTLSSTAWQIGAARSEDPKVQNAGYLDAFRAVRVANGGIFQDAFEPNDFAAEATLLLEGQHTELTLNNSNWDYYAFSVSDYCAVVIDLEFMRDMGPIYFTLTPLSGIGVPSGVIQTADAGGYQYFASTLAPGSYRILLSANWAHYYFLTFHKFATGLHPDQFEANNTPATATDLQATTGSWDLTLHNSDSSDVDYFLMRVPSDLIPALVEYQEFGVSGSDYPVTVEVRDPATNALVSQSTGTDVLIKFSYDEAGKEFLFKVFNAYTRYVLSSHRGSDLPDWSDILAYDPFWWLVDPIGPVTLEEVLAEEEEWIAIQTAQRGVQSVVLTGAGLSVALYDEETNLMEEGIPLQDCQRDPAFADQATSCESLDTSELLPDSTYLLRIWRSVGAEEPVDGTNLVYPRIAYTLEAHF